jgi:hypothetical protein
MISVCALAVSKPGAVRLPARSPIVGGAGMVGLLFCVTRLLSCVRSLLSPFVSVAGNGDSDGRFATVQKPFAREAKNG